MSVIDEERSIFPFFLSGDCSSNEKNGLTFFGVEGGLSFLFEQFMSKDSVSSSCCFFCKCNSKSCCVSIVFWIGTGSNPSTILKNFDSFTKIEFANQIKSRYFCKNFSNWTESDKTTKCGGGLEAFIELFTPPSSLNFLCKSKAEVLNFPKNATILLLSLFLQVAFVGESLSKISSSSSLSYLIPWVGLGVIK